MRQASLLLALLLPGCSGCSDPPPPPPPPPAPAPPPGTELRPLPSGGADMVLDSFEGTPGQAPKGWRAAQGHWTLVEALDAARGPTALLQDAVADPWTVILRDGAFAGDLTVSVRFKLVAGKEDASGGIVLRAQDTGNYLLVRANALEGNLRLYRISGGRRETLASAEVAPPAMGAWHILEVALQASEVSCALDGRPALRHALEGRTWPSGRIGLWTKADSRTAFDDLLILRIPSGKN